MKASITQFCLIGLLVIRACAESTPSAPTEGFVSLFNARDLQGWEQILDAKWTVENEILVARQNPSGRLEGEGWLLTQKDYGDFILRLKFRITPGGNSGIYIRDPLPRSERQAASNGGAKSPSDDGYEVNINNDHPNYPTGSVWAANQGTPKLQDEGGWNEITIRVQGRKIWTMVNGKVALDGAELPSRSLRGAIGFQCHGAPKYRDKVVEFKDIEIREL